MLFDSLWQGFIQVWTIWERIPIIISIVYQVEILDRSVWIVPKGHAFVLVVSEPAELLLASIRINFLCHAVVGPHILNKIVEFFLLTCWHSQKSCQVPDICFVSIEMLVDFIWLSSGFRVSKRVHEQTQRLRLIPIAG